MPGSDRSGGRQPRHDRRPWPQGDEQHQQQKWGHEKSSTHRTASVFIYLSVLSGIAVVGNDSGDSAGRGTADGGDHEHQLHEVVVDVRRAGGLQIRPQTQHVPG